jgi:thiol-disulfide isomerase/thioredoxin
MNKPMTYLAGGVAAAIAIAAAVFFWPASERHASAAAHVVGEMQNFRLAPTTMPRPPAAWTDGKGKKVTLADFQGKVVLFNYYASWCAPCRRELPGISHLQAKLAGKGFTVVALNIDRGGAKVARRMLRQLKVDNLDLHLDPKGASGRILGLRAMPTTYLFDRQGREVGKLEGIAEWDSPDAVKLIQYFIDNPGYADRLPPRDG